MEEAAFILVFFLFRQRDPDLMLPERVGKGAPSSLRNSMALLVKRHDKQYKQYSG